MASMLDRNLIGISLVCDGFHDGISTPDTRCQYIVGEGAANHFASAKKNHIAKYNNRRDKWEFFAPEDSLDILFDRVNKSIYRYRRDTKNWVCMAFVGDDNIDHFNNDTKLMYPYPVTCVSGVVYDYFQFNPLKDGIRNVSGYRLYANNEYNPNRSDSQLKILDASTAKLYQIGNDGTVTNIKLSGVSDYKSKPNDTLTTSSFAPIYILDRTNLKMYKIGYQNNKLVVTNEANDPTILKFTDYDFFLEYDSIGTTNPKMIARSSISNVGYYNQSFCTNVDIIRYADVDPRINPDRLYSKMSTIDTKGFLRKDPICSNIMISNKKDSQHTDMCIPLTLRTIRAQFTETQLQDKKIVIKFDKATNPWFNPIGYGSISPLVRFSVGGLVMSSIKDYKFTYEIGQHLTTDYSDDETVGIIDWNNMDLSEIQLETTDWYTITFNSMSSIGIAIANE